MYLEPKTLNVMGLMSGTSMDGIDAACVQLCCSAEPVWLLSWKLLGTYSQPFDEGFRTQLLTLTQSQFVTWEQVCRLNQHCGQLFAETAVQLQKQLLAQAIPVDLIASHGQTVYHLPPSAMQRGTTLQLGDPAQIAVKTHLPVVSDFRLGDMALGGQGAPLVPFADQLLFQSETQARAVQNIGGIANLTAFSARNEDKKMMAFDTGPGNMIIDALAQRLFNEPYDPSGELAAQGKVDATLLSDLMNDPYFDMAPPKSTGRERYGKTFVDNLLLKWQSQLYPVDLMATLTAFTVESIVQAYARFVLPVIPVQTVIVGGGGVQNKTLMSSLEKHLQPLKIQLSPHEAFGVPSQYKEAIAFAMLGYARYYGLPSNVPDCTGAEALLSLGGMWLPSGSIAHSGQPLP